MVLQSDFPTDMRVEREALSLIAAGYKVTILCDNRIERPIHEYIHGIEILRLPHRRRFHKLINMPIYPNPVWLSAIKKTIKKIGANLIHVHDLPLALPIIRVVNKFRLPIVLDLHENYPAAMELWYHSGPAGWTIRNPKLARLLEKYCLKKVDKIIVVDEEHQKLLSCHGIPTKKIHIVENTTSNKFVRQISKNTEPLEKYANNFVLFYFGKIGPERDLEVALRAFPKIKAEIPGAKLIIAGDGPHLPVLKKEANRLNIQNDVLFKGWMSFETAIPFFNSSNVCILPQGANSYINNGIPNKLFQYMSFGKPVIVSDSKAISRVVHETSCGEIFQSKSPASFADTVLEIDSSKKPYGENAKKAILDKYNWENSEKSLLKLYSEITDKNLK